MAVHVNRFLVKYGIIYYNNYEAPKIVCDNNRNILIIDNFNCFCVQQNAVSLKVLFRMNDGTVCILQHSLQSKELLCHVLNIYYLYTAVTCSIIISFYIISNNFCFIKFCN